MRCGCSSCNIVVVLSRYSQRTVKNLNDDGEYQGKQFRGDNRIDSPTFSDLNLTAEQIFQCAIN